jgi:hypothetical protein
MEGYMAEHWEGDGKDPVLIEQEKANIAEREESALVTGIFWTVALFTSSASLTGLVAWWLGWVTLADLQRSLGAPVGIGVCIALLLLPDHWERWFDHLLGFAVKCVLWTIALAAGLVMVALVVWRLSDINFGAPLTLGGAIVIAAIIVLSR